MLSAALCCWLVLRGGRGDGGLLREWCRRKGVVCGSLRWETWLLHPNATYVYSYIGCQYCDPTVAQQPRVRVLGWVLDVRLCCFAFLFAGGWVGGRGVVCGFLVPPTGWSSLVWGLCVGAGEGVERVGVVVVGQRW